MEKLTLSYTRINTFRECSAKYFWTYVRNLKPRRVSTSFVLGVLVHAALRTLYNGGALSEAKKAILACSEAESIKIERESLVLAEPLEDIAKLADDMITQYARWARSEISTLRVLATELPVRVSLGEFDFIAYVDALVEDKFTGELKIVEHKTCYSLPRQEELSMTTQPAAYAWALANSEPYKEVSAVIYNMLRKVAPKPPTVLRNGSLSKDKSQVTTRQLYLREIEARGLRREDYEDFLAIIDDNKFNAHYEYPILPNMLSWWEKTLAACGRDISALEAGDRPPIMLGDWMRCRYCPYVSLCTRAQQEGQLSLSAEPDERFYSVRQDSFVVGEEE